MSQNYGPNLLEKFWAENVYGSLDKWIKEMGGTVHVLSDEDYARADKLAAVPAQAWFKSLDKAGYRGAELEKTFHQLEASISRRGVSLKLPLRQAAVSHRFRTAAGGSRRPTSPIKV